MPRWRPPLPPMPHPLEERVRKLERALEEARETIVQLMPTQFFELLESYDQCNSTREFYRWRETVAGEIVELVPESSVVETSSSRRAPCPLCQRVALGFGGDLAGFKLPLGLVRHLTGYGNVEQCGVTKAAFELGRECVERRYGEAERAAKKSAEEEEARQRQERRKTETLYKTHPVEPAELIDDGYRFFLRDKRDTEGLAWAEARARSLGFVKHVDANVISLEKLDADYFLYADIRFTKKITVKIFRLPITKGKKIWQGSFDFHDSFKNDIEEKFGARLKEVLGRLHRR